MLTFEPFLSAQFLGIKHIHTAVYPSPPSTSELLYRLKLKLYSH